MNKKIKYIAISGLKKTKDGSRFVNAIPVYNKEQAFELSINGFQIFKYEPLKISKEIIIQDWKSDVLR